MRRGCRCNFFMRNDRYWVGVAGIVAVFLVGVTVFILVVFFEFFIVAVVSMAE